MKARYDKPLSPEELAGLPDPEIDTSEIPELDAAFWARARIIPPKSKPNVSLRLPEDVIAFFKAENPKGYTARMAAVLSAYVEAPRERRDNSQEMKD